MIRADLHSHILPGIDDGAQNVEISLGLLRKEAEQGVEHIVLTPHFDPKKDSAAEFLGRRDRAFAELMNALAVTEMKDRFHFYRAAEIRFSPGLTDLAELDQLCISGTKALLIEFSFSHKPEFISEVFYRLQLRGYTILMAHVERFSWLRDEPMLLYDLVSQGAFAQFNADGMLEKSDTLNFVRKMLKNNLLHGVGSDTHNLTERPPRLQEAAAALNEIDSDAVDNINRFSLELLSGFIPDADTPVKPKKSIWNLFRK